MIKMVAKNNNAIPATIWPTANRSKHFCMNTLINIFSYLGYVGAASVFIGAVFEGAELIVKLGRKKKYRKLFGKDKRREIVSCIKFLKPRILPFEAIGFAMMVLGLA